MKKILFLSLLIVAFTVNLSLAQSTQTTHWSSNGQNRLGAGLHDNNSPEPYIKYYYAFTAVSTSDPINFTSLNVTIEYLDGTYQDFSRVSTGDCADLLFYFDIRTVRKVYYSYEVNFADGEGEIYDIIDTWNP